MSSHCNVSIQCAYRETILEIDKYVAMQSITRPLKQRAFHAINNPDTHFVEGYEVVLLLVSDNFL